MVGLGLGQAIADRDEAGHEQQEDGDRGYAGEVRGDRQAEDVGAGRHAEGHEPDEGQDEDEGPHGGQPPQAALQAAAGAIRNELGLQMDAEAVADVRASRADLDVVAVG
ncbi:hypothetical protein [Actinoplanes philippinensis]|uniref:hypothetical protein n=1 Tax=Actinoplanes philippinensis TaxID=35752 RepID=UPI0033C9383E